MNEFHQSDRVIKSTIRNFHQVNPWLYRGGQPTKDEIQALAESGMRTVICLRWGKKLIDAEKAAVESVGMEFISLPMYYWNVPSQDALEDFLKIIDARASGAVFVHCLHGADRTGFLLAMYRITRDKWTVHDAYKEMKRLGFHRFRVRHFKWMLYHYAKRHSRIL